MDAMNTPHMKVANASKCNITVTLNGCYIGTCIFLL